LREVEAASGIAAGKLTTRKCANMGFLRQKKDGTTTLNIIVPNDGSNTGATERPIGLGALIGKLQAGTGQIQGFKEDRRNLVKPGKDTHVYG